MLRKLTLKHILFDHVTKTTEALPISFGPEDGNQQIKAMLHTMEWTAHFHLYCPVLTPNSDFKKKLIEYAHVYER